MHEEIFTNKNYYQIFSEQIVTFAESKYVLFGKTHDTKGNFDEAKILSCDFELSEEKIFSYVQQYSMINTSLIFANEFKSIRGDKVSVALPLFHAFVLSIPCIYLCLGGTFYIPNKVKADCIGDIVEREKITDLWSVAAVYQSIIDSKKVTEQCTPYIKVCGIAGSYTSPIPELVTRGFHVKNGYYKLPPEKQAVDDNGWFHTGDLGVMTKEGNVRIAGRIKNIIIKCGENLGACITLREQKEFDEQALRKHLKETVSSFKVPASDFDIKSFLTTHERLL